MANKKKVPAKRGRKPIVIDYEVLGKHSARGLTKQETADALGIARNTFYLHWDADPKIVETYQKGKADFKIYLTDILINQARKGNVTAAIWLDKTRCGTRETTDDNRQSDAAPVKIVYEDQ